VTLLRAWYKYSNNTWVGYLNTYLKHKPSNGMHIRSQSNYIQRNWKPWTMTNM